MTDKPASSDFAPEPRHALLTHDRLLGRRIYLHAIVRFVAAGAVAAAALFASRVLGIALDIGGLLAVAGCIAVYNVLILVCVLPHRGSNPGDGPIRTLRVVKHASTLADYLALTVILWFLGGIRSPFIAFYLFHLIIASVMLPLRGAVASAMTATVLLLGLAWAEISGVLPPRMPEGAVLSTAPLGPRTVATVLVVYITLFGLTTALVASLAAMLREGEAQLQQQADHLERLNSQRRDLLHLTLHNLQAPVGAAGMLLRNLRNGLCGPLEERQVEQIDRSLLRLDSITAFIKQLGMLSKLETDDLGPYLEPVEVAPLLEDVVSNTRELAEARLHEVTTDPGEAGLAVLGVPRLVREALVNYLTNAIKYTPDRGSIRVAARSSDGRVRLEVSDNGIGIPPDKQHRVFGEWVRLSQKDPRLGRVDGSGLGLSIVKKSIERQGGRVGFESEPGAGSTFWLELPAARAGAADTGAEASRPDGVTAPPSA